ncbi:hypothetical protein OQA88_13393 [Cercophora sp. LCS_1]
MASFLTIAAELRHHILALSLWTPDLPPVCPADTQDRVRLRPDWDVWVSTTAPRPTALPLLLTCRALYHDVTRLLDSKDTVYELDVLFIPGCGLWPTWTCCSTPRQFHVGTVNVRFRILDARFPDFDPRYPDNIERNPNMWDPHISFPEQFRAHHDFRVLEYPNPPRAAWSFYRLLAAFLTLGPQGTWDPNLHPTKRPLTTFDAEEWSDFNVLDVGPVVPYLYHPTMDMVLFPGPPRGSSYARRGAMEHATRDRYLGNGERLGLYLVNSLWALLDFKWLSRAYGLLVYEGILDHIIIQVDEEDRCRYHMEQLLKAMPHMRCRRHNKEALLRWWGWAAQWRARSREGVLFDEPRPEMPFLTYHPFKPFPR